MSVTELDLYYKEDIMFITENCRDSAFPKEGEEFISLLKRDRMCLCLSFCVF